MNIQINKSFFFNNINMSKAIAICGLSSAGKTSSVFPSKELGIQGLPPEQTFFISVQKTELPMRGWRKKYQNFNKENPNGNFVKTDQITVIKSLINHVSSNLLNFKYIVIDDFSYMLSNEYFRRIKETGFGKFNDFGNIAFELIQSALNAREDLFVFILTHSETVTSAQTGMPMDKIKTLGKILDDKFTLEGCFNYVLFAGSETSDGDNGPKINKYFLTQSDGTNTAKTPVGVFDQVKIPNDLGFIVQKINEYENGD